METWNNLADVERAAQITPYTVVVFGALVSVSGIFLKGCLDRRAGTWNATPVLEKATRVTPYAVVLLGALVSASGIFVKGVFDRRIAVLEAEAAQEVKNTAPEVRVRLATAISDGQVIPGRTLLEITSQNDIAYNASWHVVDPRRSPRLRLHDGEGHDRSGGHTRVQGTHLYPGRSG